MHADSHEALAADEHTELLGYNIFAITMVGAVGFFLACGYMMFVH